MAQLKIVKSDEVQPQNIRGFGKEAGQIRKVLSTEKLFFNVDEVSRALVPIIGILIQNIGLRDTKLNIPAI